MLLDIKGITQYCHEGGNVSVRVQTSPERLLYM
jgi:hypothetical protein